jgi:hypothetical protein
MSKPKAVKKTVLDKIEERIADGKNRLTPEYLEELSNGIKELETHRDYFIKYEADFVHIGCGNIGRYVIGSDTDYTSRHAADKVARTTRKTVNDPKQNSNKAGA